MRRLESGAGCGARGLCLASTAPGGGNGTWVGTNAKAFQTVAQAAAVDASDQPLMLASAGSYAHAWRTHFAREHDPLRR